MNMIKYCTILILAFLCCSNGINAQKPITLLSPDRRTEVTIDYNKQLSYGIKKDGKSLVLPSIIGLQLETILLPSGIEKDKITKKLFSTVDEKVIPVIKEKKAEIKNNYNQLILTFKSGLSLEVRAFDNGVAYRFVTNQKEPLIVKNELINFNFPEKSYIYFPEEESMHSHNERVFKHMPMDSIGAQRFSSLPVLVESPNVPKVLITESNIIDYPGFWMTGTNDNHYALK